MGQRRERHKSQRYSELRSEKEGEEELKTEGRDPSGPSTLGQQRGGWGEGGLELPNGSAQAAGVGGGGACLSEAGLTGVPGSFLSRRSSEMLRRPQACICRRRACGRSRVPTKWEFFQSLFIPEFPAPSVALAGVV